LLVAIRKVLQLAYRVHFRERSLHSHTCIGRARLLGEYFSVATFCPWVRLMRGPMSCVAWPRFGYLLCRVGLVSAHASRFASLSLRACVLGTTKSMALTSPRGAVSMRNLRKYQAWPDAMIMGGLVSGVT
jgi:hypothetical protein